MRINKLILIVLAINIGCCVLQYMHLGSTSIGRKLLSSHIRL